MTEIPEAKSKQTSYENFSAQCPWCDQWSIFNRASDLKDFEPIANRTVSCLNTSCGKPFTIHGDSVNAAHEMLVFDCYELLSQKHYMTCILNLAQAYEVFFSLYFRVELLYKPFAADPDADIEELNGLSLMLAEKTKEHTFGRMRALFLTHITTGPSPKTLADAEAAIAALPDRPTDPKDSALETLTDPKLITLLKALKSTTIGTLRNSVVHKRAYRPTREEVEAALAETRSVLLPVTARLQLYDDINWYRRTPAV